MADPAPASPDINRGPQILAICGTLVGVAATTVLLRIWVRVTITRQLGWDDGFILAAVAVMLAEMVVIVPEVHYGAGRHVQYIHPSSNIVKGLHLNFVTQPLCLISLCFTKVSVGLFLLRLKPSWRFVLFIRGVIVFTVLSAAGNLLTVFFQCTPLYFVWDHSVPGGKCIAAKDLKFAAFFNSSVSLLTDLVFALLPIPILWSIQLNWKVKVAVSAVLALGIFASAAAVVKMTCLSSYGSHGDFLWDSTDITIWTTVEICTAIIAASIPSLKPLFKAILGGSSALSRRTSRYIRNSDSFPNASKRRETALEMYNSRLKSTGVSSSGRRRFDNESEEMILSAQDGIQKKTHVSVSIEDP
ncbi:integral membrane family protein [Diaporthe amygdali]|uniref:integral membrane family protein n=1 Tax=Phomopsis amygdali TaxID=1214568 RepID=UPI0022FE9EE2|nr:integral membrane family protein [Diaporthe amygdali]KAJ0121775.1 integral membrane family protein [Diaporthe amygdali]